MAINLTTADKTLRNLICGDEGGWGKVMTFWFSRPGEEARFDVEVGGNGAQAGLAKGKAAQLGHHRGSVCVAFG